jgi:hypothetical protein
MTTLLTDLFRNVFDNPEGLVWVLLVIGWLLAGFLIWVGAHVVGLDHVTLGRSVLTAFGASQAAYLSVKLFADVQVAGTSLDALLGLLLTWFVIKEALKTSMGRAVTIWMFDVVAHLLAGLLGITAGGVRIDLPHLLR